MEGGPSKYRVPPSKSPPVEPSQGLCGVLPEASCAALPQRNTGRGYSKLNLRSCFKGSRQTNISSINTWQKVWQAEITTVAHLPSIVNPVLTISACSQNEQQTSGQNQAKSMTMTMTWWHAMTLSTVSYHWQFLLPRYHWWQCDRLVARWYGAVQA